MRPKNAIESFISLLVKREVVEEVDRNRLFPRKENGSNRFFVYFMPENQMQRLKVLTPVKGVIE